MRTFLGAFVYLINSADKTVTHLMKHWVDRVR